MRIHVVGAMIGILASAFVASPVPLVAQGAAPAPGTATGTFAVAGKSVPLTHAVAFNSGAIIYLAITDQTLPPDEVKSEFDLAMYQFKHKVVGLELTLDHTRKVTETAYRWELTQTPCAGCFDVSISGGPEGPLTGTVKTTAKGQAAKLAVDIAFSAPFAKPSAVKK
jgi:hypothetical protein